MKIEKSNNNDNNKSIINLSSIGCTLEPFYTDFIRYKGKCSMKHAF